MEIYWWLVLARLHELSAGVFFITSLLFLLTFLVLGMIYINAIDKNEEKKVLFTLMYLSKRYFLVLIISFFVLVFVPSKTGLTIMFGWDALKSESPHEVIHILKENFK